MVLGEVGSFPVSLDAKCRLLCFWYKLCIDFNNNSNKVSVLMFRLCYSLFFNSEYKLSWLNAVRCLLNDLGLSFIWSHGCSYSLVYFKNLVKQRLRDQFLQSWYESVYDHNICTTYRIFKEKFCFENYLLHLSPLVRRNLLRFRLSCHKFPIQSQRYINIPREQRLCTICNIAEIGDEFHYLFTCKNAILLEKRTSLLPKYYWTHPNVFKFNQLMSTKSKSKLMKLSRFVGVAMSLFK